MLNHQITENYSARLEKLEKQIELADISSLNSSEYQAQIDALQLTIQTLQTEFQKVQSDLEHQRAETQQITYIFLERESKSN
jgi:flagellar biosynthesis chaperone FliJ